ncbi:MAG: FAD-dependent thymidylate synthase [Sulfuricurvum sp. RIFCSPLOWO2_02_FULL_43_45]|nr:MAG: FAD-dependent thymidylate synthase [Sulfuricurvum sp. RIFCSPHIGHO2_02_FULL_43_9]OHD84078.1 MAG: FAD-dependent thymidylate synthase [Sulfuricurvum sp. RIFCSPHIGHO2_12_FULL_44_8]OHD86462.1 MAG: FAD-dependent thymidylate synthase [Sulfuricurvum sp. RIFCSPLOWO2_02_FULL_43_45]OHD87026.1 MAG: FAD-dependent thymidylate synthase [Sulfuricurvum sp. RIFCSPLOWO2_02_43_6]
MKVTLHHYTPLVICSDAIRTCWQSFDKSDNGGEADRALIDRVGNKFKHASTLEHLVYNFYLEGISRALLQELARHRMASLSVKSTRYTLKELKDEAPYTIDDIERASKYLVMSGVEMVDQMSIRALENLRLVLVEGISNDRAKYCLPESYKTELTWTINARSLQNFISLRSDKAALWEIRDLANVIYNTLPIEHRYLFENSLKEEH